MGLFCENYACVARYNIIETRIVNGKKTERVVNDHPIPFEVGIRAISIIATDIEGNDKVFGNYRTELVNEGTPQENYKFGWDGDTDYDSVFDCIEQTMSWGITMVGSTDFELSYELVKACEELPSMTRAAICINTAACVGWATTDEPLIQIMRTPKDFEDLGFNSGDYKSVVEQPPHLYVTRRDFDYDGVYIIGYTY